MIHPLDEKMIDGDVEAHREVRYAEQQGDDRRSRAVRLETSRFSMENE